MFLRWELVLSSFGFLSLPFLKNLFQNLSNFEPPLIHMLYKGERENTVLDIIFFNVQVSFRSGFSRKELTMHYHLKMIFRRNNTSFFLDFYLFIFRQRGREGEREGEKHQCVAPHWGSDLQPGHVP